MDNFTFRAWLKIPKGAVFRERMAGEAPQEHTPCGSATVEQRSLTAFSAKTIRAAGLLALPGVGSVLTARCGDAPPSPPWSKPKSPAAAPFVILRQALRKTPGVLVTHPFGKFSHVHSLPSVV